MSLRQSMYTGLAQPEVKMNGLSSEKSTAFTSSSIFAVISAMKLRSAECMKKVARRVARILAGSTRAALGALELNTLAGRKGEEMFRNIAIGAAVTALAAAALPLHAAELMYRCTSKDGRVYYGQTVPNQCIGQVVEQINSQGLVIQRIVPTNSPLEDPTAKAAEEKKKQEEAARAKEEERRDNALLATYTSVKDVDDARARALQDPTARVGEIEARIVELKKKQEALAKQRATYTGSRVPPITLTEQIQNVESELGLQTELAASKRREIDSINAKYDEDKKRYMRLTGR